ncbi:MAG: hypothetical protein IKK21_02425 [Clostridia bacterium]|nr:hypothetical protein [Clostridia bacterium]
MTGQTRKTCGFGAAVVGVLLQAGIVAAAYTAGLPGMLLVTLAAWPLAAWLREKLGWIGCVLPCAAGIGCFLVPGAMVLSGWYAAGMIALVLTGMKPADASRPRWQREAAAWGGMAAVGLCVVVISLNTVFPQGIPVGLAERLTDTIGASPNSAEILYQLYQMGAVDLPRTMRVVETAADGMLYMTAEVRTQLLYGFRSGLEDALLLYVPAFAVYFTTLTTLLCVMLPVTARRRRGEKDDTPRFDLWSMERTAGIRIGCLFMGGFLPMFTDTPAIIALGVMMNSVANVVFGVLGAAVLRHAARRAGRNKTMSWVMLGGAAVIIPQALTFIGAIDLLMDMRRLRKNNETEEDRE